MNKEYGVIKNLTGVGLGLRSPHYSYILNEKPSIAWFEAISENYMNFLSGSGGPPLKTLKKVRENYSIVLHGVSMSIGSVDPINFNYLSLLKNLIQEIEPAWVSDHLCWTGVQGENLHDLLPLPYTEEALRHLENKIIQVQDFLKRPMILENVSAYLSFAHSEMTEWDFLAELSRRTDCRLLLDINNVYVSSVNQNFEPMTYLNALKNTPIQQMHLAGHLKAENGLIDTHDAPVCDEVWELYAQALKIFGAVPTLIEWDDQIPEFSILMEEAEKAQILQEEVLGGIQNPSLSL